MFSSSIEKKISLPKLAMHVSVLLTVSIVAAAMAGKIGYQLGFHNASIPAESESEIASLTEMVGKERENLQRVKADTENNLDALAIKLGSLQAKLMRLEAIGERLVSVVDVDIDKEVFKEAPAMGSASDGETGRTQSSLDLLMGIESLSDQLVSQDKQLTTLEKVLTERDVKKEVVPSGMPVKGYISSGFGGRVHPISGKYKGHQGVDIPGKRGTKIKAVAGGVVIKSERASGYGNMVEIKHADGLTTLYGHNKKNIVKKGDIIEKGDTIALLGSTGRSTGPHVHFEVRKNDKPVNPMRYINTIN
ncbi:MAG: M23 family metallopeptidase [Pseudomonadota bacterium]|nr:M23 family metallopeptidase [Pseudomonadota bacterium]